MEKTQVPIFVDRRIKAMLELESANRKTSQHARKFLNEVANEAVLAGIENLGWTTIDSTFLRNLKEEILEGQAVNP